MKNKIITNSLLCFILSIFTILGKSQIKQVELRATGLTCSMCSNAINKQLKSLSSVLDVKTDLNTNTFTVTLKSDNTLTPKVFKEKVEEAGFFVGMMIIVADAAFVLNNPNTYIIGNNKKAVDSNVKYQVLDKGYLTNKEYAKQLKAQKQVPTFSDNNEDNYHLKVVM